MSVYTYKAIDPKGEMQSGTVECLSEELAITQLQRQGYILLDLKQGSASEQTRNILRQDMARLFRRKLGFSHLSAITQQLATLISAEVPVDRSLEILVRAADRPSSKKILEELLEGVKKGRTLSDTMSSHPDIFSPFYRSIVRTGEESATLGDALMRVAESQGRMAEVRSHIISVLIYPAFLLLVSGLSIIVLMTYVVPKFVAMFVDMGIELPATTKVLISISHFLQNTWWVFLLGIPITYLAVRRLLLIPGMRYKWDSLKLKIPLVGRMVTAAEVARFSRTLATLLAGGVPLLRATGIVCNTAGNLRLVAILEEAEKMLKAGHSFSQALKKMEFFPSIALQMISVGEESGKLQTMLSRMAEVYEKELDANIKRAVTLIEPFIILTMGVLVGFIVLSMLSAVFGIHDIVR